MKRQILSTLLTLCLLVICISVQAKPVMPAIFSNNMVLQQQTNAAIWGTATAGQSVTIKTSWNKKTISVQSNSEGQWRAKIETPTAGGPYKITVTEGTSVEFSNVMIGEVWICSGQSNMEMPLGGWGKVLNFEQEIEQANHPSVRLFQVRKSIEITPCQTVNSNMEGGWQPATPKSVENFSSVAYFYARRLNQELGIPVGVIDVSWGGTIIETWISKETLLHTNDFHSNLTTLDQAVKSRDELIKYKKEHNDNTPLENDPATAFKTANFPTLLFNAMINPLIPYAIQGAIWYQGESNEQRGYQYRDLFTLLIRDWRIQWNRDFPFYFVQLANYQERVSEPQETQWADLREAQAMALKLENTGMAVANDIGDAVDIHPKNKQEVARRLSLIALAKTYGKRIDYSGPTYESMIIRGDKIELSFNHIGKGLITHGGTLKGFTIAGPSHRFFNATAVVSGNKVIVNCPEVTFPVAVRYCWGNNIEGTLYNEAGLPTSPFRTDDYLGVTFGQK